MSTCLCSASAEAVFSLIVSISDRRELAFDSLSGYTEALAEFIEIGIIISELGIYVAQKNSGIVWNFHNNLREKNDAAFQMCRSLESSGRYAVYPAVQRRKFIN